MATGDTPEDEFEGAMKQSRVRKITPRREIVSPSPKVHIPERRKAEEPRRKEAPPERSSERPLEAGVAETLRRARAAERRGKPRATAELVGTPIVDLHGLRLADVVPELRRFLNLYADTSGIVRVIVGQGLHSPDGSASVRDVAESWLSQTGAVASFRRAAPGEGGEGLLLVRLWGRERGSRG